jgi:fluoride ion exporter CrcB/FEX
MYGLTGLMGGLSTIPKFSKEIIKQDIINDKSA